MQRSMRVRSTWKLFALAAAATCCAGSAHASSIVKLEATTEKISPSMVVAGAPDKAEDAAATDERRMVSRSIVAFGPPDVTYENVASVGNKPEKPRRDFSPMVLRGGIAGGAFPSPSGAGQPVQTAPKEAKTPPADRPAMQPPARKRSSVSGDEEPITPEPAPPAPESPVTY